MTPSSENEQYRQVVSQLLGIWFLYHEKEAWIISMVDYVLDTLSLTILGQDKDYQTTVSLGFIMNEHPYIVFDYYNEKTVFGINFIDNDALILQRPDDSILILLKKPDTRFADKIISGL